ncbi:DUF2817 domain-containing protein [Photobacterium sp. ZSDE20]|uniref:DUF2817 domain-containing protein n=1 Tax=Photobacterium pectinilyticum TaxID=2906793 RepID=A0ABT1N322_9GAMM|nr:DUF2817 domain-containing protein [Photobacterium sp. ZSDE20]MCQ1059110.1 DUF2817 domain-containing protein [Photobacterium sp. ZSDE20]MDD1824341.1 DUF2817 domain-containing protein [Photobacterium sp. ZSDE20]
MSKEGIYWRLPELRRLENIIDHSIPALKHIGNSTEVTNYAELDNFPLPIYKISLGAIESYSPCLFFVGGVHGLERIGSQVVISLLESLCHRLHWDEALQQKLRRIKLIFIPLLNPVGMAKRYRSNGNHVDLMRNAPVDSKESTAWLVGGHRISKFIPWYRGKAADGMEVESQTLINEVLLATQTSPLTLALDCHSGFGTRDRLWFPYAKSKLTPIAQIGALYHLRTLFLNAFPYQNYVFEPQTKHYTCHGDLWDYLYDITESRQQHLLPITLEMGSWRWVRKNPLQLLDRIGPFHPVKPHRIQRVMRTHLTLNEFLMNATYSYQHWYLSEQNDAFSQQAKSLWYPHDLTKTT